jgi:DNA-binding transcriptional ArsR family regulator
MKPIKTIKSPEAFRLLGDETRRKIVFLLRVKEMTVSQIAAELNITPQAVYHHIKRLLKAEMVEVSREERIDHLIESYYRATAEAFLCSFGKTLRSGEPGAEQVKAVLNSLKKIGFNLKFDEKTVSQLIEMEKNIHECCEVSKLEDAISELEDADFLTKQVIRKYAEILSMSDEEFLEQQKLSKKFRDLLISFVEH